MINAHRLALSAAITTGISYLVYATFAYFYPDKAMQLIASLHMMRGGIVERIIQVNTFNLISGFSQSVLYTYVYVLAVGTIYNRISRI